jgi:hypothetical protein
MVKKILLVVAVVVVAFAVFVATRPAAYRVSRSTTIAAPPTVVYAQVADFHRWDAWSPWAKLDPSMKTTFSGPVAAPGSSYAWAGNDKVGEGRMTIVDARPAQRVLIKLEFLKPFEATSSTEFLFASKSGATQTTWTMEGRNNFAGKLFSVFTDMDKMIGNDFDRGLAQLRIVAEREARASPAPTAAPAAAR